MARALAWAGLLLLTACAPDATAIVGTDAVDAVAADQAVAEVAAGTDAQVAEVDSSPAIADWQCRPCENDTECPATGLCVHLPFTSGSADAAYGSFCLALCDAGACGAGYDCGPADPVVDTGIVQVCKPGGGPCGCSPAWSAAGLSTPCTNTDAAGSCPGRQACGFDTNGNAVLGACDAGLPDAKELCNGKDDNCNGLTDEGPVNAWADGDGDGWGAGAVLTVCSPGAVSQDGDCNDADASIHPGTVEICNGVDDNCNGQIDEGFCDDQDLCTRDLCAGAGGNCVHLPSGVTNCDDGQPCTTDLCDAKGVCSHVLISSGGACSIDGCATGVCGDTGICSSIAYLPDGAACTSAKTCGTCAAGVCVGPTRQNLGEDDYDSGDSWACGYSVAMLAAGTLVAETTCCGDETSSCSMALVTASGQKVWSVGTGQTFVQGGELLTVALSDGSAVVEVWGELLHISPAGTVKEMADLPSQITASALVADDKGGYLVVGTCADPVAYEVPCASLRNPDDSEKWFVSLAAGTTASAGEAFSAIYTSKGWLVAVTNPWDGLFWLQNDGKVASSWLGAASVPTGIAIPGGESDPANGSGVGVWPWGDGWLVEAYGKFLRRDTNGNQIGPLDLPDDVSQFAVTILGDGDLLLIGYWYSTAETNQWTGQPFTPQNLRLVRLGQNGERRWDVKWTTVQESDALIDANALSHNMIAVLADSNQSGASWLGDDQWSDTQMWLQVIDAFGNTDCLASIGCAGRPMSDCDDKDPCTADGCSAGSCTHTTWPDGTPCPGGKCLAGKCGP